MSAYRRLAVFVWIAIWGVVMLIPHHPIHAQDDPPNEILVDGRTCTLADAITAANTDEPSGGCTTGKGADVLRLTEFQHVLNTLPDQGGLALPHIITDITIEGDGHTIWVMPEVPMTSLVVFRVVADTPQTSSSELNIIDPGAKGRLTLRNLTLEGSDRPGQNVQMQAIANLGGEVWLEGVNLFHFGLPNAMGRVGAVVSYRGKLDISRSNFAHNAASTNGGQFGPNIPA